MPSTPPNVIAGGTIRPSRFVSISAAYTVIEGTANAEVIGISGVNSNKAPIPEVTTNYHAESGEQVVLHGEGEVSALVLGGTVAAGDKLKSDGNGAGVVCASSGTTRQFYGARALQAGSSGETIEVMVEIGSFYPALV